MQYLRVRTGLKGRVVLLLLDEGSCPAKEFLAKLYKENKRSHRRMHGHFEDYANIGPSGNKANFHPIRGRQYDGIWVFKTPFGDRLLCFHRPMLRPMFAILLNGYQKGDPIKPEYERARKFRDLILVAEHAHGYG